MSDADLVAQLATDVFERHCSADVVAAAETSWPKLLWDAVESAGLTRVGIDETRGGAGGGWPETAAVLRAAARYAAPIPLAETSALAAWLLDEAGLDVPAGPLTIATGEVAIAARRGAPTLSGRAAGVPWAREASAIVVLVPGGAASRVVTVSPERCRIERGLNVAREPRDDVTFEDIALGDGESADIEPGEGLRARGALVRSIQIAGALSRVLALTTEYAKVRQQFGRPIAQFQAVQHHLATLAGEIAAADAAVDGVLDQLARDGGAIARAPARHEEGVAAAKVRTSMAASEGARIAHQVHGAIGITYEHELHHYTTRLWSWRDEFGTEREWAVRLGRAVAAAGGAGMWDRITRAAAVAA